MDIEEVNPIKYINKIGIPAVFISGTLDVVVPHE